MYQNQGQPGNPNYGGGYNNPVMPGSPNFPPPPNNIGMPNPYDHHGVVLGPTSCYTQCPSCHKSGYTRAERALNSTGKALCILLSVTLILCFCVTCCDSNYEIRHYCSNCGHKIGTYPQA